MKKICSKTALSLIELIIATALVSVVLLGIFSINMVLSNNSQDYGQKYLVKSDAQTTLSHILNNASLAVGNVGIDTFNNSNIGIQVGPGVAPAKWNSVPGGGMQNVETTCIHQPAGVNNNIINYTASDIWLCYTWCPSGEPQACDYKIQYCAVPFAPGGANMDGATNCYFAAANGFTLLPFPQFNNQTGPFYLGTSISDFTKINSALITSSANQLLFSLTIQSCLNNSATACNGDGNFPGLTPGISSDPVNNPEVTVTGSVIPQQESD